MIDEVQENEYELSRKMLPSNQNTSKSSRMFNYSPIVTREAKKIVDKKQPADFQIHNFDLIDSVASIDEDDDINQVEIESVQKIIKAEKLLNVLCELFSNKKRYLGPFVVIKMIYALSNNIEDQ